MSTIAAILATILGILTFLFIFWKKLKEDYASNIIFTVGFYIVIGILTGALLTLFLLSSRVPKSAVFNPYGLWFWGSLIGAMVGFFAGVNRFNLRFFEVLEAAALGLIFWFLYLALGAGSIVFSLASLVLIVIFFIVDRKYKTFSWYRSGRVGFSGLTLLALFFIVRSVLAIAIPSMIFFVGRVDAIVSAVVSFIFFLTMYNLSNN